MNGPLLWHAIGLLIQRTVVLSEVVFSLDSSILFFPWHPPTKADYFPSPRGGGVRERHLPIGLTGSGNMGPDALTYCLGLGKEGLELCQQSHDRV